MSGAMWAVRYCFGFTVDLDQYQISGAKWNVSHRDVPRDSFREWHRKKMFLCIRGFIKRELMRLAKRQRKGFAFFILDALGVNGLKYIPLTINPRRM
jgi:hypothetical protein